ncbi:eukaryotic translation initiation factor 4E transporter [Drosophila biarmipes]|uniref:eukaryotic translation initiation factor 4E transporter n=1 Tax=Drosophila biarmipes TaxID=125945 RepID=UPI0007E78596|nr:eukaryotic translation initiation factor 4E transporter [Drosophila biarmipes]
MDTTKANARYTRADLLALRYEGKSRQRPHCRNRTELHTLGFWKVNLNAVSLSVANNYSNQNKNRLSPEADSSSLNCSNSASMSSRRAMRNRERANNYYQRFVPTESLQMCGEDKDKDKDATTQGQSFKSPVIDHRSISSSHLMPAFAKRRIAASSGTNNGETNETSVSTCDAAPSAHQRRESKGKVPSSPNRKSSELDMAETRLNYVHQEHDQYMSSSPTFSTSRQERRIGSGRLLPRSDNWEFKSQKTKEPNTETEKDASPNGSGGASVANQQNQNQHHQRVFSGRLVDRVTEHTDRRFQNDTKRSVDRQGVGNRRISNKEPCSNQNRGKRANSYHVHEEPEWFSAGPTSQLETIDLHGFDDLDNNEDRSEMDNEKFLQIDTNLAAQTTIDEASRRNSNVSLNLSDAYQSDDIIDTGENILKCIQNSSELCKQNQNEQSQFQCSQSTESEFNFDAFLNMHPLDNSLMNNDENEKGEATGTSRFSRWFRHKETANNNELPGLQDFNAQEKIGIPSVKDLEAQMTKVDMRPDYVNTVGGPFSQVVQAEKPIPRDTEGFKKLLQQLGYQSRQHHPGNDVYHIINHSNITNHDHLESNQQHKINNCHSQHSALSVHGPNIPSNSHIFAQKRLETHHLMQSLICGDVSLDFLEKELGNPSTAPSTKEVIASVLREYSHNKRNPVSIGDHKMFTHSTFLQAQPVHPHYSEELISQNTANHAMNPLITHGNSPTPLAFTPTSVLRKMTADKETTQTPSSSHSQQPQYQMHPQHAKQLSETQPTAPIAVQPRMILGGGNFVIGPNNQPISPNLQQCRNQQGIKWTPGNMQMVQGKSFGRPILKGGLNSMPQPNPALTFTTHKIEMQPVHSHHQQLQQQQTQHRFKSGQTVESILNTEHVHQNIPSPVGWHQLFLQHQQHQSRQQPRHRMLYGEMHRQSNPQMSSPVPGIPDSSDSGNVIKNNSNASPGYPRDERMPSPTNNQLAQWFSPELLAKASAGKLPLLNMNQALSLEEFERSIQHSSAVVHN